MFAKPNVTALSGFAASVVACGQLLSRRLATVDGVFDAKSNSGAGWHTSNSSSSSNSNCSNRTSPYLAVIDPT